MIKKLRRRVTSGERQGGFTLIELLVVIIIIGILLAIAVPSYLGFRDRANRTTAQANVRATIPAVEAYFSDNGTYVRMTLVHPRTHYYRGPRAPRPPRPTCPKTRPARRPPSVGPPARRPLARNDDREGAGDRALSRS